MKKTILILAAAALAALPGCGVGGGSKPTDPGQNLPVKAVVVKEKVSLPAQTTAKAIELECGTNKNLLLIVAQGGAEELSMSRGLKVNGQDIRFNPGKDNQRVVLFVAGASADQAATHVLGDDYEKARTECEKKGSYTSQELEQILVR